MRVLFAALVVVFVLGGCASSPSPVQPPARLEPLSNTFRLVRAASFKFGRGAGQHYLRLRPLLRENILYTADYLGNTTAYDLAAKRVLWEQELNVPVSSSMVMHGSALLLGTSDGRVLSLDANSGAVNWKAQVSSEVLAAPATSNSIVVVRCVNGQLYGLDIRNGSQRWVTEQRTPALTLRGTSTPVIIGDVVLGAFDNGSLIALNLQSGKELWQASIAVPRGRTDIERMVDVDANVVVSDDVVYAVAFQGRIAAVQLGSGRIIWARDIDSYTGMSVDAYRIYLTDSQGQVWAMDRNNGATLWKQDALVRRGLTRPVIQGEYVVVGDFNGFVHWLQRDTGMLAARARMKVFNYTSPDLDETEDLAFPKADNILAPPVADNNTLLVMNRYGYIELFDIATP